MAKITKSDVIKVGIGFGAGVTTAIIGDKLVVPAIKKAVANKKAKKATVNANLNNGGNDEEKK